MTSPEAPVAADAGKGTPLPRRLKSTKAILRLLRDRGLLVARSTLFAWRRSLPRSQRPPIEIRIVGMRPQVTAERSELTAWVDRMERKGLFRRSVKVRDTRARRRGDAPAPDPNAVRN